MSIKVGTLEWTNMPTGRWCATVLGYCGHIAVHAFVSGAWAVTRGKADLCKSDDFLVGSREEGQPMGADLHEAMALAEAAAFAIVEREHPDRQAELKYDSFPHDLFAL